jgi:peptide deformylase
MAIRPIFETPDPVLRQISKPVEVIDDEISTLIADMFETMYHAPGIGLAAVQVGVPIRLLVMDLQEPEDPDDPESPVVKEPRVFINPETLSHSDTGCPTPGLPVCPTNMPKSCAQTASAPAGWTSMARSMKKDLDGLLANCLQHEMDHLQGILFIDHLSKLKRDMVLKKLAKQRKGAARPP